MLARAICEPLERAIQLLMRKEMSGETKPMVWSCCHEGGYGPLERAIQPQTQMIGEAEGS